MDFINRERKQNNTKTSGTLYHTRMYSPHGNVRFIEKEETKKDRARRLFGAGLTSFSLAMFIYSYGPMVSRSLTFDAPVEKKAETVFEVKAEDELSTLSINKDNQYYIIIPSLHVKSNILPDIDSQNEKKSDEALKEGVAQAKGTALPGQGKRIYLFAHSTNSIFSIEEFNAVFYDIDKLTNGEKIDIQHGSDIFQYQVTDKKIVSSSDTSWIEPHDGEELILQTCWPKGTNWKRLLVFAKPI